MREVIHFVTTHSFTNKKNCREEELTTGSTEFFERIWIVLSQAEKRLELIHTISGTGFNMRPDICKMFGIAFT